MNKTELDIYDILLIIAQRKRAIIIPTIIISILVVIYVLIVPEMWTSTGTIKQVGNSDSSMQLASSMLGFNTDILGIGETTESAEMIAIMNARFFTKDVIETMGLYEYFEITEEDSLAKLDIAREQLATIMSFGINDETGLIHISCITDDKDLSAIIVNYYIEEIEDYYINHRKTSGKRQRIFLEKRVNSIEKTIEEISIELNEFQNHNGIIDLTEQTKHIIEFYSALLVDKRKNDIELEYAKAFRVNNHVMIDELEKKGEIIQSEIEKLEYLEPQDKTEKFILNLSDISDLSFKYAELMLKIEIQTKLYSFLFPQFEEAKISEIKELPILEIIDYGEPAGRRTSPKRAMTCVLVFIAAIVLFTTLNIFMGIQSKEDRARFKEIRKELFKFKK